MHVEVAAINDSRAIEQGGRPLPNPLGRVQVGDSPIVGAVFRLQCAVDEFNAAVAAMFDKDLHVNKLEFCNVVNDISAVNRIDPFHLSRVLVHASAFTTRPTIAKEEGGQNT